MEEENYLDVDQTVFEPSPQRVRNVLTLEERVRVIQVYDCRPMYTKVAKMFNCSWEQIKNIITNREAIMGFYTATKYPDPKQDEIRQRKIAFLGECMYEYIQRFQFHKKVDLTEQLIRMKAFEFRDVMSIENFLPNKAWINHFKATYNFSLSNRQITLTRAPPSSLDLKDIMMYCTKNKAEKSSITQQKVQNLYRTTTKIAVSNANNAALEEIRQRRNRKIDFLERALSEYIKRFQYYRKTPLRDTTLLKVTSALKEILKIDNFVPSQTWLYTFKNKQNSSFQCICNGKRPLISLDLKDILSYCSRNENNTNHICNVNLNSNNIEKPLGTKRAASPLASLNSDSTISYIATTSKTPKMSNSIENDLSHNVLIKQEIIDLDRDVEECDIKPNAAHLEETLLQNSTLNTSHIDENIVKAEGTAHSPGHWSESSDKESEELPKYVKNYTDALKLLKPLEEFAMLEENYRVIGLISQLEEIFKSSTKSMGLLKEDQ